jgi:hypothetical protein
MVFQKHKNQGAAVQNDVSEDLRHYLDLSWIVDGMNKNKKANLIVLLVAAFLLAGTAAFADRQPEAVWWEIKADHQDHSALKSRGEMVAALEKPKTLLLRWGMFPSSGYNESAIAKAFESNKAKAWVRNPEGSVSEVALDSDNREVVLPTDVRGLYLVCADIRDIDMDLDADGQNELVHFYAKQLVYHFKRSGRVDPKPEVFFQDMADKVPLEIGPYITEKRQGGGPFMGGYQTALKEHRMKVLYKGRPLAGAKVTILTESGWKKNFTSDSEGMVTITPAETLCRMEGRGGKERLAKKQQPGGKEKVKHAAQDHPRGTRNEDKYLYVVTHKDQSTGQYHCASLLMQVRMPPPEWLSMPTGFALLGVIGACLGVIGIAGSIYHKKRHDRATI